MQLPIEDSMTAFARSLEDVRPANTSSRLSENCQTNARLQRNRGGIEFPLSEEASGKRCLAELPNRRKNGFCHIGWLHGLDDGARQPPAESMSSALTRVRHSDEEPLLKAVERQFQLAPGEVGTFVATTGQEAGQMAMLGSILHSTQTHAHRRQGPA